MSVTVEYSAMSFMRCLCVLGLLSSTVSCAFGGHGDEVRLANDNLTVGLDLASGGAITYIAVKGTTRNLINIYDRGREIQQSYYAGQSLDRRAEGQSPSWSPWSWNPIQVGDAYGNSSRVVEQTNTATEAYMKTIPLLWDMRNEEGKCTFEQWTTLDANVIHIRNKLVCTRDANDLWTQITQAHQELPAVYTIADLPYLYTYTGAQPWTSQPLTRIINDPNDGFLWDFFTASERWAANVDANNWGVGVYNPGTVQFIGGIFGNPSGGEYDSSTAYIAPIRQVPLARDSVFEYSYDIIVGGLEDIRAYVYAHKPENMAGREWWHFNTDGDTEGWLASQQAANMTVQGGFLKFTSTGADPILTSEGVNIWAQDNRYVHIRMLNKTTSTTGQLFFTTAAGGPGTAGHDVAFTISANDTEPKNYILDMSKASGWTGFVTQLRFDPVAGATGDVAVDYIASGGSATLTRIQADPAALSLPAQAGSRAIAVSFTEGANLQWEAAVISGADWLQLGAARYTGAGSFQAAYSANTSRTTPRQGTIRIEAPGAFNTPLDIPVTQAVTTDPLPANLAVSTAMIRLTATARSAEFNIINTGELDLSWRLDGKPTWLTAEPLSGTNTTEIHVSCADFGEAREAVLTAVNTADASDTATVTIQTEWAPKPGTVGVSVTDLTLTHQAPSASFNVYNSGEKPLTWFALSDTSGVLVNPISASEGVKTKVTVSTQNFTQEIHARISVINKANRADVRYVNVMVTKDESGGDGGDDDPLPPQCAAAATGTPGNGGAAVSFAMALAVLGYYAWRRRAMAR